MFDINSARISKLPSLQRSYTDLQSSNKMCLRNGLASTTVWNGMKQKKKKNCECARKFPLRPIVVHEAKSEHMLIYLHIR